MFFWFLLLLLLFLPPIYSWFTFLFLTSSGRSLNHWIKPYWFSNRGICHYPFPCTHGFSCSHMFHVLHFHYHTLSWSLLCLTFISLQSFQLGIIFLSIYSQPVCPLLLKCISVVGIFFKKENTIRQFNFVNCHVQSFMFNAIINIVCSVFFAFSLPPLGFSVLPFLPSFD